LKSVGIRFAVFGIGQGARGFFPSHTVTFPFLRNTHVRVPARQMSDNTIAAVINRTGK
jgi:hypothetical protein